jgi:hypothetical protein
MKKWAHRRVRIKREYLIQEEEINEDKSVYDEGAGEYIQAVYDKYWTTINMNNGFEGAVTIPNEENLYTATFKVRAEMYGVDLYGKGDEFNLCDLPEPSHQIIIEECNWPFMWDSKYFEVVRQEYNWVLDENY